jgi:hypothetical protein
VPTMRENWTARLHHFIDAIPGQKGRRDWLRRHRLLVIIGVALFCWLVVLALGWLAFAAITGALQG